MPLKVAGTNGIKLSGIHAVRVRSAKQGRAGNSGKTGRSSLLRAADSRPLRLKFMPFVARTVSQSHTSTETSYRLPFSFPHLIHPSHLAVLVQRIFGAPLFSGFCDEIKAGPSHWTLGEFG
jgi:hypothetical protein